MAVVDASSVPEMPADATALLAAAAAMAPAAASVGERTADAVIRWSTLGYSFDTPDTSTAVAKAQPLAAIADDFEDAASAVADAIRTLGETLASLEWTRALLAAEVEEHVADSHSEISLWPPRDTAISSHRVRRRTPEESSRGSADEAA